MYTCTCSFYDIRILVIYNRFCKAGSGEMWWNRNQILKFEGFDATQMTDQEAEALLEDVLKDNEMKFGHSRKMETSPSGNKLLHRYFYIRDDGTERSITNSETKSWHKDSNQVGEKGLPSALQDGPSVVVTVKAENPLFKEFKEIEPVIASAKNVLERIVSQAEDVSVQLKMSKDTAAQAKAPDVEAVTARMKALLTDLRLAVVENTRVDASHSDLPDLLKKLRGLRDLAMTHQDGWKAQKKRTTALLSS